MSMPHSELLGWDSDDLEALRAHRDYEAESCSKCGTHPSHWKRELGGHPNRIVAKWTFCRVCELIAQAEKAGPPSNNPGWHIVLSHTDA